MKNGVPSGTLWNLHEEALASGRWPSLLELALHAKAEGIGLRGFLDEFPRLTPGHVASGLVTEELKAFVVALAKPAACTAVMEVAEDRAIHCLALDLQGVCLTYVTRSVEFCEAVEAIAAPSIVVARQLDDGEKGLFDLIVARPPPNYRPPGEAGADGFGSEMIGKLVPLLAPGGRIVWITQPGLSRRARVPGLLASAGLEAEAVLDIGAGWCPGSVIEGVAMVVRAEASDRKMIGVVEKQGSGRILAEALLRGPSKRDPEHGAWADRADPASWRERERRDQIGKLMLKGRFARRRIRDLLLSADFTKADRPSPDGVEAPSYLYVPEYAARRGTASLEDQKVAANAVYRFAVDPSKTSAAFLAHVLNTPYGVELRQQASVGSTIRRIRPGLLLDQPVPAPDTAVQDRIVRLAGDIDVLKAMIDDRRRLLDGDWRDLDGLGDEVAGLKAVLDSDRRVEDWWGELPYPLAAIYRRYRVSGDPRERLDCALHFFEVFAVFLASVGFGHVRALRSDAEDVLFKLLYPERSSGIDRADFGFWIGLAQGCANELKRTLGNAALRAAAIERVGSLLVLAAGPFECLGDAAAVLNGPREIRNRKAHGGHIKESDAERLDVELQEAVRGLYAACASALRRVKLVRIGTCEHREASSVYEAEILQGSDPTFERTPIEVDVDRRLRAKTLALWHVDQRDVVPDLPFFQLGAPQRPSERTVYVFNRRDGEALHWVSYQEASDQFIVTDAAAMRGIIRPRT